MFAHAAEKTALGSQAAVAKVAQQLTSVNSTLKVLSKHIWICVQNQPLSCQEKKTKTLLDNHP